ncbi:MAG: cell division protein ZipA [Gammaproteobacteria bacterium]|nr:cell division protein ZipA [Gammaproteobacteria bacterium]
MLSLRLLLVVIGIAIIAAVYFFGVVKRRRDSRVTFPRRFGGREFPDVILQHEGEDAEFESDDGFEIVAVRTRPAVNLDVEPSPDDGDEDDDESPTVVRGGGDDTAEAAVPAPARAPASRAEPAAPPAAPAPAAPRRDAEPLVHREPRGERLPGRFVLPPEAEALGDLPRVRNDALVDDEPDNARRGSDQLDLFGAESAAPSPKPRRGRAAKAPPPEADDEPDNGLVNLFVRAHDGRPFGGPELVRALNAVGMRFGDMSVFHHYGAGDLRCDRPVFSAANMFEPGTFDLARIEAFRTSGIVLFMQLPAPLEGPVAFELLLNSAQRLAELTGGELYASPKVPLDSAAIARLRNRAARYGHAG